MNDQTQNPSASHRAYYSLVLYCPDLARLEATNVGVVVFRAEPSRILEDHQVRLFPREVLSALIDEIPTHGHVISA